MTTIVERMKAGILFTMLAVFLTACNEPQQQPQVALDENQQQQQVDDGDMDTAVAAAAGAAVGSIAGNMLSRPSQPVQQAQRPVIINRTTVIKEKKTVVINKQPSRSSRSFSYSRPSSRRR